MQRSSMVLPQRLQSGTPNLAQINPVNNQQHQITTSRMHLKLLYAFIYHFKYFSVRDAILIGTISKNVFTPLFGFKSIIEHHRLLPSKAICIDFLVYNPLYSYQPLIDTISITSCSSV